MDAIARRDFVMGTGMGTLGAATLGGLGVTAQAKEATVPAWDKQADVLVIGCGAGGLITAARAAETGASVLVLEASTRSGSTMLVSNGFMSTHGSNSVGELQANAPLTDSELGAAFIDAWDGFLSWCEQIGAPMSSFERETDHGSYTVYRFGTELPPAGTLEFADFVEAYAKKHGADFIYQTVVKKLITNDEGAVIGAKARTADGSWMHVGAKEVVLACGGFQRNKELNVRYVGPHADLMVGRGNPHDTGAGMQMALEVGAQLSRGFGTFYGHPVPWGIDLGMTRETWDANCGNATWISQAKSIYNVAINCGAGFGIAVNMEGERFVDETKEDQLINQAMARQTFARAYEIIDAKMRADNASSSGDGEGDVLDYLLAQGGTLLTANTLEGLADQLAEQGVPRANVLASINEYNEAVDAGTTAELRIPKASTTKATKLEQAPFYALPVVPSHIFPYGGVKVDTDGRVIDMADEPIPGLWATQGVAGGMQYDYYIGILCSIAGMAYTTGGAVGESALA